MRRGFVILSLVFLTLVLFAPRSANGQATLLKTDNRVEVSHGGAFSAASAGQTLNVGDQLRTGEDSRATVQLADGSVLQLDELTTIEIKPATQAGDKATLNMPKGSAFFFSRGKSREVKIETPAANGAIRGTAFVLKVTSASTAVSMIEGAFTMSNGGGSVTAHEGQAADAGGGGSPTQHPLSDSGASAPWYLVLENHLSHPQALRNANHAQFFSALPNSIKQYKIIAPQLSGAATLKRREWALQILEASFDAAGPDCGMRTRILRSIIEADPADAPTLHAKAVELGPSCAEAFTKGSKPKPGPEPEEFAVGPFGSGNFGNPPGLSGGGQGGLVAVCFNGQTLFFTPDDAQNFLKNHPGATLGACQVTPVANP